MDVNDNQTLEASEVQATSLICNGYTGADGYTSLIEQWADSPSDFNHVCPVGGVRIESGVDLNDNGQLETIEVAYTSYVCNGQDGFTALVVPTADNFFCSMGGIRYDSGLDLNMNGVLGSSEVTSTQYVCNGDAGWIVDLTNPAEYSVCSNGGTKILSGPDLNGDNYLTGSEVMHTTYLCNP